MLKFLRKVLVYVYDTFIIIFLWLFQFISKYFITLSFNINKGHWFKVFKKLYKHLLAQHFFLYSAIKLWYNLQANVRCIKTCILLTVNLSVFNVSVYCRQRVSFSTFYGVSCSFYHNLLISLSLFSEMNKGFIYYLILKQRDQDKQF